MSVNLKERRGPNLSCAENTENMTWWYTTQTKMFNKKQVKIREVSENIY